MSTPIMPKATEGRRVIARSSDGRVIHAARVHDPMENVQKAWGQTGRFLRTAMDTQRKTMR
ncbi:hypothetical protein B842_03305 [Corynebacterium humireducens NBRC 106098 = DSM 45392]|uniref:Uncharacterized protein n=1 Tax=Corynebacterium humireducens NBRC 106098 = DSM 45392 TaxID=1223515 RepID=A0A0B5D9Z0_9CORY|nr:hypothetical protein B842_03305 [Corynebacterium humireducens NBRC 106098 = DSM 45392]